MSKRWVVEGEWTGYHSGQRRVVHREIVSAKEAEAIGKIGYIRYTDGTGLALTTRAALPRERVQQVLGYRSLIRQCVTAGHGDVARLPR